jgi:hypothetical protein
MTGELFSAFFLHEPADEIPYGIVNICAVVSRPTHESFGPIFRRFEAHCTKTTDWTDGGADAQVLFTLHHEDSLQSYSGRLIGLEYDTTGTGGSPGVSYRRARSKNMAEIRGHSGAVRVRSLIPRLSSALN